VGIALAFGGCTLAPRQDRTHFIILAPASIQGTKTQVGSHRLTSVAIGLGPIQMPEYLDRPELLIRTSATGFELSDTDRWGEPLADNFRHVLTDDLTALLPDSSIVQFPWYPGTRLDYIVRIQVQRFEADAASRRAVLAARWELMDARSKQPFLARDTQLSEPITSLAGEAVAAALSQDVVAFAQQIAAGLDEMEQERFARSLR
jgi:uncharacterized lipoprotein YmbA